jgi:hypothetical protein
VTRSVLARWSSFLAAVASMLTLLAVVGPAPAKAAAAGCTNANGVTVVVDLRQLGGGILERCAPGLGAGATGLQALQTAGVSYQGTSQWGDGFICRLLGRPAADESLRIPGNNNYHEQCITTPPSSAYWAYWWASNGGPWHYSSAGVSGHRITPGGFEGWVFTLNGQQTSPGVAPVRADAGPAPVAGSSHAQQPDIASTVPTRPSTAGAATSASAPALSPASGAEKSSATPGAEVVPSGPSTPSGTAGPADPGVSTDIAAVGGRTPSHGHGISTGAILGACLLAFLLTIGGGTAWRQARARRQS